MKMYRQGDVLFIQTDKKISKDMPREEVKGGRQVIEFGEVTGHAHAFYNLEKEAVEVVNTPDGERILNVLNKGGADLKHEEHSTIHFEQGQYAVRRQREYDPIQERLIAD